jgi:hypothetical protein
MAVKGSREWGAGPRGWLVRMGLALALLLMIAPVAMAAPAAQEGDPQPILLGELASATLAAGESASFIVETPDDGLFLLTSALDDEASANFTVVITDEDGNELFNDVLQTAELELDRADYILTATAAADGELAMVLTGEFGELGDNWGDGEMINGGFIVSEAVEGPVYADLEVEKSPYWQQAFITVTGAEDEGFAITVSGDYVYEYVSDSSIEGPLVFWTRGGDYVVEISPVSGESEGFTVVALLSGRTPLIAVGEESELTLQPGTNQTAVSFDIEEAGRLYTVTLEGADDLDVDMAVSLDPTQDTWSSYNFATEESVTFLAPAAGTYFLRAYTSDAVEEAFPMIALVEMGDEAMQLIPGVSAWGEVPEGESVVFSLPVPQGNVLLSILLAASNEQDLDLSAQQVNEEGLVLNTLSTYSSGSTEILAASIEEAGDFQVTVSGEYANDDTPFVLLARVESAGDVGAQYASSAEASSQYGETSYSAMQATGAPNVPSASDNPLAWTPENSDEGEATLTVSFEHAVTPTGVRIFETYNPGAVVRIEAFDLDEEEWVVLWEGQELTNDEMRVFSPELDEVEFQTNQLRITLDTEAVSGWNEIDAVELIGVP